MNLPEQPAFEPHVVAPALAALAEQGVYLGTSSWKYPGWVGSLYQRDRYMTRGRFATARFERDCLEEFAEVFRTVCVDAGYYRFPSQEFVAKLMEATPTDFVFTFKVADEITARRFPKLPRHGAKAGQLNEHFLNAELFETALLSTLAPWREKVGVLIFEFSQFYAGDFERGRDFIAALSQFLERLPRGWRYGVEIRNRNFLHPDYFAMLRQHQVAHVFNQWTRMPDAAEQIAMPGSQDCADFTVARMLLRQGRGFEEAVQLFSPYEATKEPHESARGAAQGLIQVALDANEVPGKRHKRTFVYVNNRLEGNALQTVRSLLQRLGLLKDSGLSPKPPSYRDTLL